MDDQLPEYYLYDGNQELGAYQSGQLKNLQLPGIAVELDGEIFAPILDCQRNSLHLVSLLSESIAASYQQTAFGELLASSGNLQHPWRYAGKRLDTETGLVYFGHRYYDPALSRWLTTDPAGFVDSLNLYQYVLNNPFRYYDPDGQFALVFALPLTSAIFPAALAFLTAPVSIPVLAAVAVGSVACVAIAYTHPEIIDYGLKAASSMLTSNIHTPRTLSEKSTDGEKKPVRTEPKNLGEQLALEEAKGGEGKQIMEGEIKDLRYPSPEWRKKQHVHYNPDGTKTNVHYWENAIEGTRHGFKFKDE